MTDIIRPTEAEDSLEDQIKAAKTFLLRSSPNDNGFTMYDHLITLISQVLETKPESPVGVFETLSRQNKRAKFSLPKDTIQDVTVTPSDAILAYETKELFNRSGEIPDTVPDPEESEEPAEEAPLADVMENMFYFEQAGIGIGREEMFRNFLALQQLTDTYKLQSCRFWGKMLGVDGNYTVAEVKFVEGQDPCPDYGEEAEEMEEVVIKEVETPIVATSEEDEVPEKVEEDDTPKTEYKAPPVIPKEAYGTGCNKYVYFVCSEAGLSWHRLPPVTPAQIVCARQIRKLLTGRLDEEVICYPPFPGKEMNYLRAQIARISAATHVSPQGYYVFEEDDEDDDAIRDTIEVNLEFEGVPVSELCDQSLSFWSHHNMYILPQGRTTWFNPLAKSEEEEEEEEEEEDEREEPDEMEPEEGPPLLSPLSEDLEVNLQPAWTPVKSSSLVSQYAIAVLMSNLWPGACAFAHNKKFENIYIGYGLKYNHENYSPPLPPPPQEEYPSGPEITEHDDPTVEQERALKAAQAEAEEEEAEEEEESDQDEDD